jgi:hypothetical protein
MDLEKAVKQAVRFCETKDENASFTSRTMRFIPQASTHEGKAQVVVHNGGLGLSMQVDIDLPNCVLDASLMQAVSKDLKPGVTIKGLEDTGYGRIKFILETTGGELGHTIPGGSKSDWEGFEFAFPNPNDFVEVPHWPLVQKVFHAVSKDYPFLGNVKFAPTHVEATDKSRYARVDLAGTWEGLVPAILFKFWTRGPVETCFTKEAAFFRVGDELRFHTLVDSLYPQFPDCSKLIPDIHEGADAIVPTDSLQNVVKSAIGASPTDWVAMDFGQKNMVIRSYQPEGSTRFESELPVKSSGIGSLLVNGKYILDALAVADTPNVHLYFGEPLDPLRIESGHTVECVWPVKP